MIYMYAIVLPLIAETDKIRKSKGIPSYLQLTKSAASKRVIKYVIQHTVPL